MNWFNHGEDIINADNSKQNYGNIQGGVGLRMSLYGIWLCYRYSPRNTLYHSPCYITITPKLQGISWETIQNFQLTGLLRSRSPRSKKNSAFQIDIFASTCYNTDGWFALLYNLRAEVYLSDLVLRVKPGNFDIFSKEYGKRYKNTTGRLCASNSPYWGPHVHCPLIVMMLPKCEEKRECPAIASGWTDGQTQLRTNHRRLRKIGHCDQTPVAKGCTEHTGRRNLEINSLQPGAFWGSQIVPLSCWLDRSVKDSMLDLRNISPLYQFGQPGGIKHKDES